MREKKSAFKATDLIDRQVRSLMAGRKVESWAPGRRVKWRLMIGEHWRHSGNLQVYYRFRFTPVWWHLNPGFHLHWERRPARNPFVDQTKVSEIERQARVILGQIAVGKRRSGRRLWELRCGRYVSDGTPVRRVI